MDNRDETRRRSAALFGNEKTVEVVLALHEEAPATAQTIAARTGIPHSLVRDALLRLTAGGAVRPLPRLGGTRSPQYYQPDDSDLWTALSTTAQAIIKASERSPANLLALGSRYTDQSSVLRPQPPASASTGMRSSNPTWQTYGSSSRRSPAAARDALAWVPVKPDHNKAPRPEMMEVELSMMRGRLTTVKASMRRNGGRPLLKPGHASERRPAAVASCADG